MKGVYRDPLQAMRDQVSRRREACEGLERQITDALRARLPAELTRRLQQLRGAATTGARTAGELTAGLEALESYESALREAHGRVPGLLAAAARIPDELYDPVPAEVRRSPRGWAERRRTRLQPLVTVLDGVAQVVELDPDEGVGLRCRFRSAGVPVSLLVQPARGGELLQLATNVPAGLPALRAGPRSFAHSWFLSPLGLVRDDELGHSQFDEAFVVDVRARQAAQVLTPEVRRALLAVAACDVPVLQVGEGLALLRWRYEPTAAALEAAVCALAGIRAATPRLRLLRDG